jgi:hypothetical protein
VQRAALLFSAPSSRDARIERRSLQSGVHQLSDIVLINPRFEISFWGFEFALPFLGKRANMPVAALPLLAALTPPGNNVTIIDENVEPIDFDRCARADIVGVTGMVVQRQRMHEILLELKKRNVFTVLGGPWVSVNESSFAGLEVSLARQPFAG